MNLPNWISAARIGLVPVFLLLAYAGGRGPEIAALVVFVAASVSDFVDGYLARRNGVVSRLGQSLDPIADKLLVAAALVVLVDLHPFPLWAALVIAAREAAVSWLRARVVRAGASLPASMIAKAKTVVQMTMVGWWLLPWGEVNPGHWVLLGLVLFVTLWSGVEYFRRAMEVQEVAL
jgi:CDP-diacylglycerol---glycerol-3-phosphate 3-phosphatidyltransferase